MENGQKEHTDTEEVSLELSKEEEHFLLHSHNRHIKCDVTKCNTHLLVHFIIRLEAARRKFEHDLGVCREDRVHGSLGVCDRCKWTNTEWIASMAGDWGQK